MKHPLLSQCLTAEQLIEQLRRLPKDTLVGLTCDYGDYGHTTQFLPVKGVKLPEDSEIAKTAYSNSGWCVRELEEGEEPSDDLKFAILN